ncbi:neural cell adhesion molecule 1-B [Thunnus thynnus]|uniref:neural cell adhesion molecule 1-B n=1 Tax=Thunnus thynnus TaxID=8237 RepID=UPI003529C4AE
MFRRTQMIKASSLSSAARTQHVFGLVSIIWLTSAVSAVGEAVGVQTIPRVVAHCGDNVTLTCDTSSLRLSDITLFSWVGTNKTLCEYNGKHDPEVMCESTAETTHQKLTLTLINVMPIHHGKYLCKVRSKMGVNNNSSFVTIQDCPGSSGSFINETYAGCFFNGVYPSGTVHWFQGDVDLTESASMQEVKDKHGRYDITSTINVQKGHLTQPYNCSLWLPHAKKYFSSKQLPMVGESGRSSGRSSGSVAKLQWICMITEMVMVKFMM